jgi:uncharacterized membrane protein YqiK
MISFIIFLVIIMIIFLLVFTYSLCYIAAKSDRIMDEIFEKRIKAISHVSLEQDNDFKWSNSVFRKN